jgi:transcriptional regulator with XRE-family HTH domain
MESGNGLGEYLRARRERIRPEEAGLTGHGRRRTPGLRREELALLAGISSDYLVRLEQGRERRPSAQVLDALARALQLDDDATAHLHALASLPLRRLSVAPPAEAGPVPRGIELLLGAMEQQAAFVHDPLLDVLAANRLAWALSPVYSQGGNGLRATFLDEDFQALYRADWDEITEGAVAGLRGAVRADLDEPRVLELVEELSAGSELFRRLWARHDVRLRVGGGVSHLEHPAAGPIELIYEKLAINGTDLTLIVYHAEPGTRSAEAFAQLAELAADVTVDRA